MLKLARLRGGGSLSPRNEGPLMAGAPSEARGGSLICGLTGADSVGALDTVVATRWGCAAGTSDAASSVAPHMPQKRFNPGFSLPQRGQRTEPPAYSLRYFAGSMQDGCGAVSGK